MLPVLIVAATLLLAVGVQEKPSREKVEASAKKVKNLQKDRIATLNAVVEISFKLASRGHLDIREVAESRMTLLKAELDAAEKESDRIALYKGALDALKEYEALANQKYRLGRATQLDGLAIKARRLEVEIWLEQADIKAAK